jgi:DNA-binding MarR family transcriptional regulator
MSKPVRGSKDELIRRPRLPATPADLEAYLPHLLNWLTNRWAVVQNRDLGEHGINGTLLRTLSVLYIYKTLTVNEIASHAVVDQSNASRTIDSMVAAGLVERQIAEKDLRRREIALTDKGERLLKQLWPVMARNHEKLIGNIPAKDLKVCIATVLAMIRNIGDEPN